MYYDNKQKTHPEENKMNNQNSKQLIKPIVFVALSTVFIMTSFEIIKHLINQDYMAGSDRNL